VLSGTEFRRLVKLQLALTDINAIWSTLFERLLNDDMPGAEQDAVLRELYERARRRGMLSPLLTQVIAIAPDLRKVIEPWIIPADNLDFQTQLENKSKAGRLILPYPRNINFRGRETELERTHRTLISYNRAAIQAVAGLGGLGKTQLALEYAYRYHQDYQYIFWITAETNDAIDNSYRQIAEKLRLGTRKLVVSERFTDLVIDWLSNNNDWLLIFSNVEDVQSIGRYLPASSNGRVLLTTRLMATGNYGLIRLRKFTLAEGQDFLRARSQQEELMAADEQALAALVREVDGLPLALDLAAAYVSQGGISWAQYWETYNKTEIKPLALKKEQTTGRENWIKLVYKVLMLSLERLKQTNPATVELLYLAAFLASDGVSEEFFQHSDLATCPHLQALIIDGSGIDWEDMLELIQQFALIRRFAGQKIWGTHGLTQLVLRNSLTPILQRQYLAQAAALLELDFPPATTLEVTTFPATLQPHLRAILHYASEYQEVTAPSTTTSPEPIIATNSTDAINAPAPAVAAAYAQDTNGLSQTANNLPRVASSALDSAGSPNVPDQTNLLFAGSMAAAVLGNATSVTATARSAPTTPLIEHEVKKELSNFSSGVFEIARPSGELNNSSLMHTSGALSLEEDVDEISTEADLPVTPAPPVEPSPPRTTTAIKGRRVRRHSQSLHIDEEVATTPPKTITPAGFAAPAATVETLAVSPGSVASNTRNSASLELAESLAERKRSDYFFRLQRLASLWTEQGKYMEAESLYLEMLTVGAKIFGEDGKEYAAILNELGECYFQQGRYEEAEPLLQQALMIRKTSLGGQHPLYLNSLHTLAGLYYKQGGFTAAEQLFQEALDISRRHNGINHPDYATGLHNLARLYYKQERYEEAEPLYKEALAIWRESLGEEHLHYATGLNSLASLYYAQGRYEEAEQLYSEDLMITKAILGDSHAEYATSLHSLARLYVHQGRDNEAEALYQQALAIKSKIFPRAHPDITHLEQEFVDLLHKRGYQDAVAELAARREAIAAHATQMLKKKTQQLKP
jgi:tetratricopeptide (TPR) repeat protein